jgi:chromosome segregation ATPase
MTEYNVSYPSGFPPAQPLMGGIIKDKIIDNCPSCANLRAEVERLTTENDTLGFANCGAIDAIEVQMLRAEQAEAKITEMEESISNNDIKRAWKRVNDLTAQSNKLFYQLKQAEQERDELRRQLNSGVLETEVLRNANCVLSRELIKLREQLEDMQPDHHPAGDVKRGDRFE